MFKDENVYYLSAVEDLKTKYQWKMLMRGIILKDPESVAYFDDKGVVGERSINTFGDDPTAEGGGGGGIRRLENEVENGPGQSLIVTSSSITHNNIYSDNMTRTTEQIYSSIENDESSSSSISASSSSISASSSIISASSSSISARSSSISASSGSIYASSSSSCTADDDNNNNNNNGNDENHNGHNDNNSNNNNSSNNGDTEDDDFIILNSAQQTLDPILVPNPPRECIAPHKVVMRKRGDQETRLELYGAWQTVPYEVIVREY